MPIRLLIVDDHARVRTTLKMVLSLWDALQVVGEASSGQEAIQLTQTLQPDVVLMDLDMPEMDGVEATRLLSEQFPEIRILILTNSVDMDRIKGALAAGAAGYLLKTAYIDEIASTIHRAVGENL